MPRFFAFPAAAASLLVALAGSAAAAPQILGLVATLGPVPLVCADGLCAAELTPICLEEKAAQPVRGTIYLPHGGKGLRLVGVRADGTRVRLPDELMALATARGHTSLQASVPVAALAVHDVASFEVEVARNVTMVPKAIPGDPRPLNEADIALVAGPLRALAARIVDDGGARIDAARLTARVISALPGHGTVDKPMRQAAWETVSMQAPEVGPGRAMAKRAFEGCVARTSAGFYTLRQCLGARHDGFVGRLNTEYWEVLKTGS